MKVSWEGLSQYIYIYKPPTSHSVDAIPTSWTEVVQGRRDLGFGKAHVDQGAWCKQGPLGPVNIRGFSGELKHQTSTYLTIQK